MASEMASEYTDEEDLLTPLLQIGDKIPNFSVNTFPSGFMELHQKVLGNWTMIVTTPKNNHPVSVSALAAVSKLKEEFDQRNIRVYGLGVDTKMNHRQWVNDVFELQEERVEYPLIVDSNGEVSKALGLVRPNTTDFMHALIPCMLCVVIDPDLTIQLMHHYPLSTGHNFMEVLRVIDSLMLTRQHKVATPANWMVNENVFIDPKVSILEAGETFVKGFLEIRQWFRITATPD